MLEKSSHGCMDCSFIMPGYDRSSIPERLNEAKERLKQPVLQGLLTIVCEEYARKNVEEKLKNERMRMGKKDILKDKLTVDTGGGKGYNEAGACLKNHVLQGTK